MILTGIAVTVSGGLSVFKGWASDAFAPVAIAGRYIWKIGVVIAVVGVILVVAGT